MITKESIQAITNSVLENTELFPVEINVKPGNRIVVYLDKLEGITIEECADISQKIESHLNRDVEDFELEVSSPGLTQPFKVKQQYFKNVGKDVDVVLTTGEKIKGKLITMNDNSIEIEFLKKVKKEGSKKTEKILTKENINYSNIKSTKVSLDF
jgi:ribosome maturation factor RimP